MLKTCLFGWIILKTSLEINTKIQFLVSMHFFPYKLHLYTNFFSLIFVPTFEKSDGIFMVNQTYFESLLITFFFSPSDNFLVFFKIHTATLIDEKQTRLQSWIAFTKKGRISLKVKSRPNNFIYSSFEPIY